MNSTFNNKITTKVSARKRNKAPLFGSISVSVTAFLLFCALLFSLTPLFSSVYADEPEAIAQTGNTKELIPGGFLFGVKISIDGIMIDGFKDVTALPKSGCPGRDAGLQKGDVIVSINGKKTESTSALTEAIEKSDGSPLIFCVRRNGELLGFTVTPIRSSDGHMRVGMYVKDESAGIGTVTFIDPETMNFSGLGHGISDTHSGAPIPIKPSDVTDVLLTETVKGKRGAPGELHGMLGQRVTGELWDNKETGVYGHFNTLPPMADSTYLLPVADKDDVTVGDAYIISSVTNGKPEMYKISINEIDLTRTKGKNFSITVKDKALIEQTNGIVRGMSGSPIIQNGRIIGAVTHVTLDDPRSGYGIFIGNILEGIPSALQAPAERS